MTQLISDADMLAMLEAAGNDVALFNGTLSVTGVYNDKFLMLNELGEYVETNTPMFYCRNSDITTVVNGQSVNVASTDYFVDSLQPDSQGMTVVVLRK